MARLICDQIVKDQYGVKVECGIDLPKEGCPNRAMHVGKYISGFCSTGLHEGIVAKNVNDKRLPTCQLWKDCSCKCHDTYSEMFALAEMDRMAVDNSGYVPERADFYMPSLEELALARISSSPDRTTPPALLESELPDQIPATNAREWTPTPTGRAARGELEYQIKWACDVWMVDRDPEFCTPKHVSEEIASKFGIRPPSVGAIDAAWNRWVLIGFAIKGTKPTRFLGYTEEGINLTLKGCKERFKLEKARAR